jgi:hypothetical protein
MPDHIKILDNFKSFKRISVLLHHAFYSVDEFLSSEICGLLKYGSLIIGHPYPF